MINFPPDFRSHIFNYEVMKKLYLFKATRDTINKYTKSKDPQKIIPKGFTRTKANSEYQYWSLEDAIKIGQKLGQFPHLDSEEAQVLLFAYPKGGGSHKTTTANHCAKFLALLGYKVLAIPLDFQLNFSQLCGFDNSLAAWEKTGRAYPGLAELILEKFEPSEVIFPTVFPNVDIIPETQSLSKLLTEIGSNFGPSSLKIISKAIKPLKKKYDFIIMDTNPAWSPLTTNAILASDVLVAPIGTDPNSRKTLSLFLGTLRATIEEPTLKDIIFIPSFYEDTVAKQDVLREFLEKYPHLFIKKVIRKATKVDEATHLLKTVFEHSPKSGVSYDYISAFHDVHARLIKASKEQKKTASEIIKLEIDEIDNVDWITPDEVRQSIANFKNDKNELFGYKYQPVKKERKTKISDLLRKNSKKEVFYDRVQ